MLAGTLRTTGPADQVHLQAALRRVVRSTAATLRATAEITLQRGGPLLTNDARCSELAAQTVRELFGAGPLIEFPSLMVSENFGGFLEVSAGLMALIGARNAQTGACFPHHHPRFNINEDVLYMGRRCMWATP